MTVQSKEEKKAFRWPRKSHLPCGFKCKEGDLVSVRERDGCVLSRVKASLRFCKKKKGKTKKGTAGRDQWKGGPEEEV